MIIRLILLCKYQFLASSIRRFISEGDDLLLGWEIPIRLNSITSSMGDEKPYSSK